jgi:hypothetical protein
MEKFHRSILISVQGNLKCRSVFKRHETDQAFQKDTAETATICAQKEAS